MKKEIDVSVILSTYNRCDLLAGALSNLISQSVFDISYEIIVVDNNSTDNTSEVVKHFASQSKAPFLALFESRQGLSYGWNTGIRNARGRIIALTDDDLVVEKNYVVKIHEAFINQPEVSFLGGKVLPHWTSPPGSWLTEKHWSPLALQDYGDESFYTSIINPIPLVNKAFRHEVFTDVGMFRPELGKFKNILGDVADHDLMIRVWDSGGRGIYAPTVVVYAKVQKERITKDYHRKWHNNHGRLSAIMAIRNKDSELFKRKIAGAPVSPYRRLFQAIKEFPKSLIKGSEADSFYYENRIRYAINYLLTYYYILLSNFLKGEKRIE